MSVVDTWLKIILTILLSLAAVTVGGQSPPKPKAGALFQTVNSGFEIEVENLTKTRGVDGYNPSDVNDALQQTKDATLASIPPKDKPLRGYVERSFPAPVDASASAVEKEVVENRFSLVRELLAKLSRLDSFRLDLIVNTRPANARFELVPRVGTHLTSTTNSRLTNVYRGEYEYTITKAGYKRVHETINFIERAGSILECDLQPDTGPEDALPCNFR